MTLSLAPLASLRFTMPSTLRLSPTPSHTRVVVELGEITLEGPQIRASQRGPAADFLTLGPEGTGTLDLRFTVETHDGALIYVEAGGRVDGARFTEDGGPMYVTPRFETGDPRYGWLNAVQAVGKGYAKDGVATFALALLE